MAEGSSDSPARRRKCLDDFQLEDAIGEGSYGEVKIALEHETGRRYAAKILSKRQIIKVNKSQYVSSEKTILNTLKHPNIVGLHCTFQDKDNLYFIMELCPNGDLLSHLKKVGAFDINCTKFYAAEVLSALAYMHSLNIVHRDIKPENVLLSTTMHAKVSDFGCAKQLSDANARSNSFCGTAEYVCPELLVEKSAGIRADMWSFGCLVYQLFTGRMPFRGFNDYTTFQAVIKNDYVLPDWLPADGADLIKRLLVSDPRERLTAEEAKAHPFFADISWDKIYELAPPQLVASPYFVPLSPVSGHLNPLDSPPPQDLSPTDESPPLSPPLEIPSLSNSNSSVRETSASISSNVSSSPPSTPPSSSPTSKTINSTVHSSHKRSESAHNNKWTFLNANEEVLKTGWMNKRSGFSSRKRLLFITNQRLVLVNPKGKVKCSATWNKDSLVASSKNDKILVLTTATQVFKLLVPQEESGKWVEEINSYHAHKCTKDGGDTNTTHAGNTITSKDVIISTEAAPANTERRAKRSNSIL